MKRYTAGEPQLNGQQGTAGVKVDVGKKIKRKISFKKCSSYNIKFYNGNKILHC